MLSREATRKGGPKNRAKLFRWKEFRTKMEMPVYNRLTSYEDMIAFLPGISPDDVWAALDSLGGGSSPVSFLHARSGVELDRIHCRP